MSLWVIIPVKPLNRAKSRLATVLSPEQRYEFAATMLRNVLAVSASAPQVTGTLVISRDTKALAIARDMGAKTVQESNRSDLNPALNRATEVVRAWGGQNVLILPADLPFVTIDDIDNIIDMSVDYPGVVIATDREQDGTNALLVRPAGLFQYSYGVGSFGRHVDAAHLAGATVSYYESESMCLDIDVPADLDRYNAVVTSRKFDILTPFFPDLTP